MRTGTGVITFSDPPERLGGGPERRLHIVLVEPEIPPNTGNLVRLSAATGAWLHLVEPLGFDLDTSKLRRAGLDYWPDVRLSLYPDFAALERRLDRPSSYFFSKSAERLYTDVSFPPEPVLVFGKETAGLEPSLRVGYADRLVRIPMRPRVRSLNLANAVSIAVYEVIRQHGGLPG